MPEARRARTGKSRGKTAIFCRSAIFFGFFYCYFIAALRYLLQTD